MTRLPVLRGFRARIAAMATAVAVTVGVLIIGAMIYRSMRDARRGLESAGQVRVERLAADVVLGLLAGNREEVTRVANSLLALPDTAAVAVYRGRALFASAGPRSPVSETDLGALQPGRVISRDLGDVLVFEAPVLLERSQLVGVQPSGPEIVGAAQLVLSLSRARAEQRTTLALSGGLLGLGIALAIVLSTISAKRVARPVQELMRAAEDVGAGRLDVRLPSAGTDEIGRLTERFNRMVEELRAIHEERAQTERELREYAEALRDADRRKDDFLAMLAHELRNPLAPIRNSAFIIRRAPEPEKATRALDVLDRQINHLARLVDDLLDVSRIQRGKVTLQRTLVDLGEATSKTVDDFRSVFASVGVELELDVPTAPVRMEGDETRLSQIVGNLLQNAAKFTPRGGRVIVTLRTVAERARLTVRDTGVGIDPEIQQRLFHPFEQADRTLARTTGGLGLGLSLVKGLVTLHGGTVEARSEGPGRGAEFIVELPVLPEVVERAPLRAVRSTPARRLRILVIEDNPDTAETLRDSLELDGHTVEIAADGEEGVAKALAFGPDAVLCDIGLPGKDGYEVARAIRRESKRTRPLLVAVTGYAALEDVKRAAEAGFDHHVAKPADLEEVRQLLAQASR
jgi:signal transduction histidine kinase/ActR/RegA family two-component response regulator